MILVFTGGLVAPLALAAVGSDPRAVADEQTADVRSKAVGGAQELTVAADVEAADVKRDKFTATTLAELRAAAAERRRAAYARAFSSYDGPSAADYIKNPDHPEFSLSAVYDTALQYVGVPYVFGGSDPSGFDCSGFIMFVYAQYGVPLAHSVRSQAAVGTPIAPEDAQPGDVVIWNDYSHNGFYAGDGKVLHAPYPGASVRVQPIWTDQVRFVRFGIAE